MWQCYDVDPLTAIHRSTLIVNKQLPLMVITLNFKLGRHYRTTSFNWFKAILLKIEKCFSIYFLIIILWTISLSISSITNKIKRMVDIQRTKHSPLWQISWNLNCCLIYPKLLKKLSAIVKYYWISSLRLTIFVQE